MIRHIHASCENRGPWHQSVFWMTTVRVVAFLTIFNGVPLPPVPVPANAPAPLRVAKEVVKEAVEPQQAEAFQVKRVVRGRSEEHTSELQSQR